MHPELSLGWYKAWMLEGQEVCQLIMSAVSIKIDLHCMVLMSTHLLVYGIVTKLEYSPGAMEVLMFWPK
jgi:hypothetical protein